VRSPIFRHARWALCAGSLCGALAAGCAEQTPTPKVFKVSPQRIYTDRPQRLTMNGSDFLPRYHFELSQGRREADDSGFSGTVGDVEDRAPLRDFVVVGPTTLTALLVPGLPAGVYSLSITDPRGAGAIAVNALEALGPDLDAPQLSLLKPAPSDLVAPGTVVTGRVLAEDESLTSFGWRVEGRGGLVAEGACPPGDVFPQIGDDGREGPALTRVTCDFRYTVPLEMAEGEALELRVVAIDGSPTHNLAGITRSFVLRARPAVTHVDPPRGSADGGTDVVIKGTGLPQGTVVLFGDQPLLPGGGTRLDDHTIVGHAPPGRPGAASIRLVTPLGEVTHARLFEYLAPPMPLALDPAVGPPAGGGVVRVLGRNFTPTTRVLLGSNLATAVPLGDPKFIDPAEIRGVLPPGQGQASVFVIDAEAGIGQLPAAFAWKSDP
jgi:hypothetical protein